ncbi:taxane 13-alpha-hydroxylase-like [Rhodamnia argentea]|uniref:Taxane 13-alpha-hydroxylase-like n=1 Tax=Rhodamnia argentea TaxID=178133 RepID=A0A8B8PDS5_9MYRT|nr:taxane 13-alpha-hydroxylase-like [Rhodamnia argentea]
MSKNSIDWLLQDLNPQAMSFSYLILATFLLASIVLLIIFSRGPKNKSLPKGSLGFPIVGETLSFLIAQRKEQGAKWVEERISKYGSVFKTSLMGSPTVVIIGQAGNKFILTADDDVLAAQQPPTIQAIGGKNNLFELTGSRYKLIKGAMLGFLKPESLQNYVKRMDDIVRTLILEESRERDTIKAVVFMKKLTFNVACDVLFGIKDEFTKERLFDDFNLSFKAIWSLPLNFPGTVFRRGLQARSRIVDCILPILRKRKEEISAGTMDPRSDVISCLLALRDENGETIDEGTVVDNFVMLMIASHDTSAILLSLMIWKLVRDPKVYKRVLAEHEEILKGRDKGGGLSWGDLQKMRYTWRVAQELMRLIPPVFGSFRKALKDISFGGYKIPKGWQVLWVAWGTHTNGDVFERPDEFEPSRFEGPSRPIPPFTYLPFGGGLRTCIGNEFARVETLTVVHNLVTGYEWSQLEPEEVITRQPMPYPSMGLPIKIRPRKSS